MAKDQIADVFSSLDKLNPEATYLSENALSNVDTWYDTGCYALNAIIELYKAWDKPEKVAEYEAFLSDTLAISENE